MISILPLNIEQILKVFSEKRNVMLVEEWRGSKCVSIVSISKFGTGFWFVQYAIKGQPVESVTLDPGGRDVKTGNSPFWEVE